MIVESAAAKGGSKLLGYSSGLLGMLSIGLLEKVPQGFVAVRVHNGNITRPKDSIFIPEWKRDTVYGRYNAGIHIKPPYFQHFEQVDLRDIPTDIKTKVESSHANQAGRRVHDVAATVVWGVPAEYNDNHTKRDFGVTYDTILIRALTRAGKDLNDRKALETMVSRICTADFRTIMQDYDDPLHATSDEVYDGLAELSREKLFDYGVELRDTFLVDTAPTDAQTLKDGLLHPTLPATAGRVAVAAVTTEMFGNVIKFPTAYEGELPPAS